jgi:serine/threonine-protein kinase
MLAGSPPFHSASPRELLNLQCTAPAPPLPDDVRGGLPRGVEDVMFQMLEKAPSRRPASAKEVADRLAPFCSAIDRGPRTHRMPNAPSQSSSPASPPAGGGPHVSAKPTDRASPSGGRSGDTLHSDGPKEASRDKPRTDTVALVERATEPKQVPTLVALVAILALSVLAGVTTYVIRLRTNAPEPASTTTTSARAPAP